MDIFKGISYLDPISPGLLKQLAINYMHDTDPFDAEIKNLIYFLINIILIKIILNKILISFRDKKNSIQRHAKKNRIVTHNLFALL